MGKQEEQFNRRRLRMAYITSVVSITLVLFVLGLIGTILLSAGKLATYVKENLKLQIGLYSETDAETAEEIRMGIQTREFTKNADLITPDEALEEFKKTWNEDPTTVLGFNPLGYTIELTLKAEYTDVKSINSIENMLLTDYGEWIRGISKDENLIRDVNINIQKIQWILLGISLLLGVIMVALINNTIRLAIYSKRFTIKTMQLVGATAAFIRRPFLVTGILQGLLASFLAILSLTTLIIYLSQRFNYSLEITDWGYLLVLFSLLAGLGILISYLSTYLSVRKFLKLKVDELY
ncbi:MAG: permease-like cell division protein FtsX [Flavobacteriales bacterium]|nr:permease-like cell division protein FtsX [Flavobacteriales bacterium]